MLQNTRRLRQQDCPIELFRTADDVGAGQTRPGKDQHQQTTRDEPDPRAAPRLRYEPGSEGVDRPDRLRVDDVIAALKLNSNRLLPPSVRRRMVAIRGVGFRRSNADAREMAPSWEEVGQCGGGRGNGKDT